MYNVLLITISDYEQTLGLLKKQLILVKCSAARY